jgi:hypothetical protein
MKLSYFRAKFSVKAGGRGRQAAHSEGRPPSPRQSFDWPSSRVFVILQAISNQLSAFNFYGRRGEGSPGINVIVFGLSSPVADSRNAHQGDKEDA